MRAAFYGRFSTDRQRETSITDQERICAARAAALGLSLEITHADEGVSGSTPVLARAGGARLIADALAGRIDVLIMEGLDRLSRDMVEQEQTIRRLEHRGIRIIGVSDGYDSDSSARKLHRGMRGLINEVYLDDLRAKTHRGLAGQVSRGMHAGGLSYGYRTVPVEGGHRLEIDQDQAGWVRWIFTQYMEGWSAQRIAHELNRRGVPSSRGGTWAVSAIYGNPARLAGVLNNELYVGRYIWNRSQWMKNPDTGRRVRVDRPREEWSVREMPELRIVADEVWAAARERMGRKREAGGRGKGRRTSTLFGGLLRCASCGGAVVAVSGTHYGCAARKDRGPAVCPGVRAPRRITDTRLLGIVRDDLLSPEALLEIQAQVRRLVAAGRHASREAAAKARSRLIEVDAEIGRLTDAIAQVGISPALAARLKDAELRREQHAAALAGRVETEAPLSMDRAMALYKQRLMDLDRALSSDVDRARALLSQILGPVTLESSDTEAWVTIHPENEQARNLAVSGLDSNCGCGDALRRFERRYRII
jgi:DNA invertase Pin-like site-specific DNA recombinase